MAKFNLFIKRKLSAVDASYFQWYNLFFWGIITHPLLDSFTTYGTQLFLPFSDYRVSWNVISVVDPLYTIPFLIFVIIASILRRGSLKRTIVNWIGIGLSSAYMLFCVFHKFQFNAIFEKALVEENIEFDRYMTTPMILNNVLWQGIAETDSTFVQGYYSFMQEEEKAHLVNTYRKNRHLLNGFENDEDYKTLQWFSNDYYSLLKRPDGDVQYNDLRFGIMASKNVSYKDFVFKFVIQKKDESLTIFQPKERAEITEDSFKDLWGRINGKVDY